jgi:hypothetical protein
MESQTRNYPAKKILIPLNRCNVIVAGIENKPLPHYIDDVVEIVKAQKEPVITWQVLPS